MGFSDTFKLLKKRRLLDTYLDGGVETHCCSQPTL